MNTTRKNIPQLICIAGGPGSGKSYFYESLKSRGELPKDAIIHDPDLIMEAMPEYQVAAKLNPADAFKHWELPARQIANERLMEALTTRSTIIYIRSLALPDSLEFLYHAKKLNYKITLHILLCDLDTAINRIEKREKNTYRHLPLEELIQRHETVEENLPELMRIADEYFFYENNTDGKEPIFIELNNLRF